MPRAHLRHPVTLAEITVVVPPTGLSPAYARSGWVEFTPEPEPDPEAVAPAKKKPAEPATPTPAATPELTKE